MSVIFQASNGIMAASLLGSSSHLITAMIGGGGGERLARASRLMRLVHRLVLYRGINGGGVGGADEASKRTQKNGRKRDEKPGEKRNENGKTTRSEAETKTDGRSKQAGRDNEGMRQSRTRTKTPIIIFARPPHHRLSSVRRPQMFPRPPGRGMSG